jgi:hypothetical protein
MKKTKPAPDPMEAYITQAFEENYERLRYESGHALTPEIKQTALNQALMYWRKLRAVAERITETEVKLNLPDCHTPKGRAFGIEGVVDIVREAETTTMYDIKTHDPDYIAANKGEYEKQLNVYAYIWQNLHGQPLDETAIIATPYTAEVKQALAANDPTALAEALLDWEPIIPIPFNTEHVEATIDEFGKVVDAIEDGKFGPPPASRLNKRETKNETFGTRTCRNCDARFSCGSYREFAQAPARKDSGNFRRYFEDYADEEDLEIRRDITVNG